MAIARRWPSPAPLPRRQVPRRAQFSAEKAKRRAAEFPEAGDERREGNPGGRLGCVACALAAIRKEACANLQHPARRARLDAEVRRQRRVGSRAALDGGAVTLGEYLTGTWAPLIAPSSQRRHRFTRPASTTITSVRSSARSLSVNDAGGDRALAGLRLGVGGPLRFTMRWICSARSWSRHSWAIICRRIPSTAQRKPRRLGERRRNRFRLA
jgi:hypothetical protein